MQNSVQQKRQGIYSFRTDDLVEPKAGGSFCETKLLKLVYASVFNRGVSVNSVTFSSKNSDEVSAT